VDRDREQERPPLSYPSASQIVDRVRAAVQRLPVDAAPANVYRVPRS
jgi:hypothetical protein